MAGMAFASKIYSRFATRISRSYAVTRPLPGMVDGRHRGGRDVLFSGGQPDRPARTDASKGRKPLGFDVAGVEAFLPSGRRFALYTCRAVPRARTRRPLQTASARPASRSSARIAARTPSAAATNWIVPELVISRLDPLISQTTGVALTAQPRQHVENLNYSVQLGPLPPCLEFLRLHVCSGTSFAKTLNPETPTTRSSTGRDRAGSRPMCPDLFIRPSGGSLSAA